MNVMVKKKRQDGWWYPWVFVAAFGVIIAVNATMAYIALDSWTGLETQNAFRHGKFFNAELAQKAAQDKLGWHPTLVFEPATDTDHPRSGTIRLTFTGADGQGVNNLAIEALLMRPVQEGYDHTLEFTAQGAGIYVARTDFPLPGQWEVRITASRADDIFKLRQRIQVP